jgi:hypothetical protein
MSPHDFGDMHESALIFVPAATFGQLIPKCDTALQALQLPKRICNRESLDSAVTFGCGARTGLATFYGILTSVSWRLAALLPGFLLKSPGALAKLVGPAL